jgi:hypothetical protein
MSVVKMCAVNTGPTLPVVKMCAVNTGPTLSVDMAEVRVVVRAGEEGRDCIRFETVKYN